MSARADIIDAIGTQSRVVHALMLREAKSRFGRQKLGYLWAVLEPTAFITIFAMMFAFGDAMRVSGILVVPFMITGFTPFLLFRNTMTQTIGAIETNRILLTFPQVTPTDLVFARAFLEIATLTAVFLIILAGAYVLGFEFKVERPLEVLAAVGCLATTGLGLGACFAACAPFFRSIQMVVGMIAGRPLFFLSGLFFTAEMMPSGVREILLLNPILHMIEWLRSAFFKEFESQYMSIEYAVGTALVTLCFGLLLLRGLRKKILAAV